MEDGLEVPVGLSVGIAFYPDDTRDLDALFTLADNAMYRDKAASRTAETRRA